MLPSIKGTAKDGETLTARNGTWKGTPTITYAYQWETCNNSGEACNNISGATSSTYKLKPTEVGDTLRVIVTAENAAGSSRPPRKRRRSSWRPRRSTKKRSRRSKAPPGTAKP